MEGGGGESPNGVVIDGNHDFDADLNEVVCALCGDGGELICCDGPCLRSYHTTVVTGHPSGCRSLGFTEAQVEAMQNFMCRSCRNRRHRCATCGQPSAMKHVAASTTSGALAHNFTLEILKRLTDAEFGLLPAGHFGVGDHIDRVVFSTTEKWYRLKLNL